MPKNEHLVLCGGLAEPRRGQSSSLSLNLHGTSVNISLQSADISKRLLANIPDVLFDLLEIATYIYAADCAISRGGRTDEQMGARWRRNFRFVIPVRRPELWSSGPVSSALVETLSFLSDDDYQLEFRPLADWCRVAGYLEFSDGGEAGFTPDEVMLFSGGLDSLGGAVEELARGKRVALVSHRSASKIAAVQKNLVERLRDRFGAGHMLHVPVWANLDDSLGRESTRRTRSFLFAALGAVTARLFDRDRICFFENGVVSLNLPPVAQVVGARATRTTHPRVLAGFRRVLAEVLGRPFDVDNPFAWMTKSEVVERISANGCNDFIRDTRSCTRVHDMTIHQPHCGQCSQCIDRRFAILAAGLEKEDPAEAYKIDLFTGQRPPGPDQEMALSYVRSASEVKKIADVAFFARYGEASRAVAFFRESPDAVAGRILDLYRRHAVSVCSVFDEAIATHAPSLREGRLPATCLLTLVVGKNGTALSYPDRIRAIVEPPAIERDIRIAFDEPNRRVVFDYWGEIAGASARLLFALAGPYREAQRQELAPENYPFIKATRLVKTIECENEQTLRRRVLRCRNRIAALASEAGEPVPPVHAVIENIQWKGYRLNPDRVRIIAISELRKEPLGPKARNRRDGRASQGT